jgi:hypothetical protein
MLTGKVQGILMSIILIVIALLMLPLTITSTKEAMTDYRTQAFPGCVVAATTTDVVLTVGYPLYHDNTDNIVVITATGGGAVPVAGVYTALTRSLNVTGLGADTPQDLTVRYAYDSNTAFTGVNSILALVPLLVTVGLLVVAVINGLWAIKK